MLCDASKAILLHRLSDIQNHLNNNACDKFVMCVNQEQFEYIASQEKIEIDKRIEFEVIA